VLAFASLGIVPATFIVGQVNALTGRTLGFLLAMAAVAAALGGVAWLAEQARPGAGAVVGVGVTVVLVTVDVLLGAPMQMNTVFGYSVAVAGRFTGLGNLAFALFGSAVIVLTALIVDRVGNTGVRVACVLLGAAVLIEGLPMLGADVGGLVSMVPAFGVTGLLLAGRRVTGRDVAYLVALTAGTLFAFAFLDAARPSQSQTHLARLAQHLVAGRWGAFGDTLARRWHASFGGAELAAWGAMAALILVTGVYVALVAWGWVGPRAPRRDGPWVAGAVGMAVLAVVGLAANDSSIAVPTTMLIVVVPVVVLQVLGVAPPDATEGER
jgi:hypothetical protein